jgi:hypothetical protein
MQFDSDAARLFGSVVRSGKGIDASEDSVYDCEIAEDRTLDTFKILFPYVLTSLAFLVVTIFSAVFMMSNKISDLRTWLALALTATFIVCCVATVALIIGNGNGTMKFDEKFLQWLGGATIAEVAGIVMIVFRFFFTATATSGALSPK